MFTAEYLKVKNNLDQEKGKNSNMEGFMRNVRWRTMRDNGLAKHSKGLND